MRFAMGASSTDRHTYASLRTDTAQLSRSAAGSLPLDLGDHPLHDRELARDRQHVRRRHVQEQGGNGKLEATFEAVAVGALAHVPPSIR